MIASYANDPKLFERCINLINEVFPGCKEFALNGIKYHASWSEGSTPFIIEDKGEIIAHAGVWPLTFMLNGKEHHTASIHGVCVKPEHRGKGYFKQLMKEAIVYVNKKYDSSILFTVKPYLYKDYPYQTMLPEYDFIVSENFNIKAKNSDLRALNLETAGDLKLLHDLLTNRIPLSNQLSVMSKNANTLFVLNTLHKKIHYSEKFNVLIVFEVNNKTLYIKEIVSQKPCQITDIFALIPNEFDKIVFQFCPDKFLDEKEYTAVLAGPECCIMVSESFHFDSKYFRYPELYWC
jgi:predicted acetyltransferase